MDSDLTQIFRADHSSVQLGSDGRIVLNIRDASITLCKADYMEVCGTMLEALRRMQARRKRKA